MAGGTDGLDEAESIQQGKQKIKMHKNFLLKYLLHVSWFDLNYYE